MFVVYLERGHGRGAADADGDGAEILNAIASCSQCGVMTTLFE
jgi:hypothetical protein